MTSSSWPSTTNGATAKSLSEVREGCPESARLFSGAAGQARPTFRFSRTNRMLIRQTASASEIVFVCFVSFCERILCADYVRRPKQIP